MSLDTTNQPPSKREIIIALIGLVGVLFTAVISNWDKLFPRDYEQAASSGYHSTGDYETEARYNIDVSNLRKVFDMSNESTQTKLSSPKLKSILPTALDFEKAIIGIYRKHYSLAELQELNKWRSNDKVSAILQKEIYVAEEFAAWYRQFIEDKIRDASHEPDASANISEKLPPDADIKSARRNNQKHVR